MSTTVLEALQNAQMNLQTVEKMGFNKMLFDLAMEQLGNGIKALENGKEPDEVIQENMFSDVDVGEKPE